MKLTTFLGVLFICIYIAEGHTYGYGKRRKYVKAKIIKLSSKKHLLSGKGPKDPCPPIRCALKDIPVDCLKKTFFIIGGVKCRGCDKNICINKFKKGSEVFNEHLINDISKLKEKVKVPVPVPVEFPVKVPVELPVKTPVNVPVRVPVEVPVRVPVQVPVPVPVGVPVPFPVPVSSSSDSIPREQFGSFSRPTNNLLNVDPLAQVNTPPSDNEFVNRMQFDRNNLNLLQPQDQNPAIGFPNGNSGLLPSFQNIPGQFQNQFTGNQWSSGLENPNQIPSWQNQIATTQLQAQQAATAAQIPGQQSWGQFQGQQAAVQIPGQQSWGQFQGQQGAVQIPGQQSWGQFQGQQAAVQIPGQQSLGQFQGQQGAGAQGAQGFPSFGFNPNPFLNGMQQQIPQPFLPMGAANNMPAQTDGLLNQIPPVPGINGNFQLQSSAASNGWVAPPSQFTSGQSNNQNNQGLSLIDPITNQALPGNLNSLHGPIGS